MIKTLFATIILALAFTSVQASNITISGSVQPEFGLFSFRPVYVTLHNLYQPVPDRTIRVAPLWPEFAFDQVYPGDKYTIRAWSPKGGLTFTPEVILLDEPQDDVVGITFYYQNN